MGNTIFADNYHITTPRKAMGELLSHAVRFGRTRDVLAAGQGIETLLSARRALPSLSMAAALSASYLTALLLPEALRRLYILGDRRAGEVAVGKLADGARTDEV